MCPQERIIEVPTVEVRELIKHVPKTTVQYIEKKVAKHITNVTQRQVVARVRILVLLSQERCKLHWSSISMRTSTSALLIDTPFALLSSHCLAENPAQVIQG